MKISDILAQKQTFSYEIFPPKGELPVEKAREVAARLGISRSYVSRIEKKILQDIRRHIK